jgi:hypothetical protein
MSLKRVLCVASFSSAVALSLYGAGCSSSSPGGGGQDSGSDSVIMQKDGMGSKDTGGPETLPSEVGMMDSPSSSCMAGTYSGSGVLHPAPAAGTCTPAILDQLLNNCFMDAPDASETACSALTAMPTYSTCFDCMEDDSLTNANISTASATWGGIIFLNASGGNIGFYNLGGCVAALDPSTAGQGCATAIENNIECLVSACSSCTFPMEPMNTPVPADGGAVVAYEGCQDEALPNTGTGPCTDAAMAVTTACASETKDSAPGPGSVCFTAVETLELAPGVASDAEIIQSLKVLFASTCAPGAIDGG